MIRQAIIPLAGLGTRLLPLTSVFPKELLPIHGKPGIEYILDECIEAGIKEVIFIISNKKKLIKKYFTNCQLLKKTIKKKKDKRLLNYYNKILKYNKMIKFVYQNQPKGTGDAVLKTKRIIKDKYVVIKAIIFHIASSLLEPFAHNVVLKENSIVPNLVF